MNRLVEVKSESQDGGYFLSTGIEERVGEALGFEKEVEELKEATKHLYFRDTWGFWECLNLHLSKTNPKS